jgi:tryptophan halogenase
MEVPEHLAHKIALFGSNARAVRDNNEMFRERSWAAVMLGQGIRPRGYHPFVDNLSDEQLSGLMGEVKSNIARIVAGSPSHQAFLEAYCQTEVRPAGR